MLFKRLIYIACFIWLCRLDHILGSETGRIQYATKNYTGVVIAIIILTAYSIKDFIKIPYLVWTILFFIGRFIVLGFNLIPTDNPPRLESVIWNVGIYGIVLIRFFYQFVIEKKRPRMNWPVFAIWFVMLLGMVIIRWDLAWPKWFLFMFGCFYLTDFKEKDLNNLFVSMVEGIIVGFLLVQGYACLHRPYDVLRYVGAYGNSNINALFYLTTYAAVLCKWYQMKLKKRPIILRIPMILLCGVLYSLTFLTGCRTAIIMLFILTVLFLFFQMISRKRRRVVEGMIDGIAIVLAVVVSIVPSYNAIRYIPAIVDEPVYIEGELQEYKIQKGDPIDSEKYISLEVTLEHTFGRFFWMILKEEETESISSILFPKMKVLAVELDPELDGDVWEEYDEVYVEPGTDQKHPILGKREYLTSPVKTRATIYRYYIEHSKLIGKRDGVDNIWVVPEYSVPHSHNVVLEMVGDFGWIIGGIFAIILLLFYHLTINNIVEGKQGARYYRLFVMLTFVTTFVGFGMLDRVWAYGQLIYTMFYLMQYGMYHKNSKK